MKIAGITRVRNEAEILQSTLDHYAEICNAGIYLLDDASTDETAEVAQNHEAVVSCTRRYAWQPDPVERFRLEGADRNALFHDARRGGADYIICFDADERIELEVAMPWACDWRGREMLGDVEAYWFRLWDFYITPDDVSRGWESRTKIGPEYRDILMMFRADRRVMFADREPRMPSGWTRSRGGDCRHYGKAMSVSDWESTCVYYRDHHPEPYSSKWARRMGHAIHTESSFGNPLIEWPDRESGLKLTPEVEAVDIYN